MIKEPGQLALPVQEALAVIAFKVAPGCIRGPPDLLENSGDDGRVEFQMDGLAVLAEKREPPSQKRTGPVGDEERWVNLESLAGSFAPGTSAKRQVVGKNPGVK